MGAIEDDDLDRLPHGDRRCCRRGAVKPRLAVILAAGRGVRLGALGQEMPKGFITMGGQTLIGRSITALRAAGIERVRIVTGHLAGHYEALATRLGDWVSLTHNPDYATTGSLASLMSVGPIDESYLLVESDLIYEPRAPRLLIESSDPDLLLASGSTGSGDEVYVAAENGRLIDLTKRLEDPPDRASASSSASRACRRRCTPQSSRRRRGCCDHASRGV